MAEKKSTNLCNRLMNNEGFKDIFNDAQVRVYAGTPPATADGAITGNLLVTVQKDGTTTPAALDWEATITAGQVLKLASSTWNGTITGAGTQTATHFRLVDAADDDSDDSSTKTFPRIQGTVAAGGGDMNLGNTSLVNGATFPINYFSQGLTPT